MKGGTKEGAASAVETKRKKYGPKFFSKNGTKGGKARNASPKKHLTFKDTDKASEAGAKGAQIRWAKYYAQKAEDAKNQE